MHLSSESYVYCVYMWYYPEQQQKSLASTGNEPEIDINSPIHVIQVIWQMELTGWK